MLSTIAEAIHVSPSSLVHVHLGEPAANSMAGSASLWAVQCHMNIFMYAFVLSTRLSSCLSSQQRTHLHSERATIMLPVHSHVFLALPFCWHRACYFVAVVQAAFEAAELATLEACSGMDRSTLVREY